MLFSILFTDKSPIYGGTEPQSLISAPNIPRRLRWASHIARMQEDRIAFKILTGTPKHRWEDNIRMNLKEKAINTRNWVN